MKSTVIPILVSSVMITGTSLDLLQSFTRLVCFSNTLLCTGIQFYWMQGTLALCWCICFVVTLAIFAFTRHHHSSSDNHFQCHSSVVTLAQRSLTTLSFVHQAAILSRSSLSTSLSCCCSLACCTATMSSCPLFFFRIAQTQRLLPLFFFSIAEPQCLIPCSDGHYIMEFTVCLSHFHLLFFFCSLHSCNVFHVCCSSFAHHTAMTSLHLLFFFSVAQPPRLCVLISHPVGCHGQTCRQGAPKMRLKCLKTPHQFCYYQWCLPLSCVLSVSTP